MNYICEHRKRNRELCLRPAKFYRHCEEGTSENLCGIHANYEAKYGAKILHLMNERVSLGLAPEETK